MFSFLFCWSAVLKLCCALRSVFWVYVWAPCGVVSLLGVCSSRAAWNGSFEWFSEAKIQKRERLRPQHRTTHCNHCNLSISLQYSISFLFLLVLASRHVIQSCAHCLARELCLLRPRAGAETSKAPSVWTSAQSPEKIRLNVLLEDVVKILLIE